MKNLIPALICLFLAIPCQGTIIYVDANGSADFETIQAAINNSNAGDKIIVAVGTYKGDGNRDIDFLGKAITVQSSDPNDPNIVADTIIDCNGTETEPHRGFYFHNNEDGNSVVKGLSITNGNFYYNGSGIYCENSSPIISSCVIKGNVTEDGAAVMCVGSSALVSNCAIVGNTGAGILCSGNTTIAHCIVSENTSVGIGGNGTIISNCTVSKNADSGITGTNTMINKCTIKGNESAGIWYYGSSIIKNSIITVNNGVGISVHGNNSKIANTIITGNKHGGIYISSNKNITADNCTITGNTTNGVGGGIHCRGRLTLCNSILYGNTDSSGSEIYVEGNQFNLSSLKVSYTNIDGGRESVDMKGYSSLNWELGNINIDPCFADPGYWDPNGTPEDANDDFWVNGNYHLRSEGWRWTEELIHDSHWYYDFMTSRCIDAGNPGSPLADELMTVPDDPCNIWGENIRINMGAYGGTAEAGMPPYDWALLSDLTNDGTVNFDDFAGQANDWLKIESKQPGDLNRNGTVDTGDLGLLTEDWLGQTSWF